MNTGLTIFLFIYICFALMAYIFSVISFCTDSNFLLYTVNEIYERTTMNKFGCCFVWFIQFLCNPISWIMYLLIWILIFVFIIFYKLFHIGRK